MGGANPLHVDGDVEALDGDQPGKSGTASAAAAAPLPVSSTSLRAPPAQMVIERPSFPSSFCLGANPPHLLPLREVPRDHNPVDAGLVPFCL